MIFILKNLMDFQEVHWSELRGPNPEDQISCIPQDPLEPVYFCGRGHVTRG